MSETPASLLGFEYHALIDDISKKSMMLQSTISKDCSQHEIDALLDKCRIAVDRQRVFGLIEAAKINILNKEELIIASQRALAESDKKFAVRAEEHGGRAERGLSASEREKRMKDIQAIQIDMADLVSYRKTLARLSAIVDQPLPEETPVYNGDQGRWADNGGASL